MASRNGSPTTPTGGHEQGGITWTTEAAPASGITSQSVELGDALSGIYQDALSFALTLNGQINPEKRLTLSFRTALLGDRDASGDNNIAGVLECNSPKGDITKKFRVNSPEVALIAAFVLYDEERDNQLRLDNVNRATELMVGGLVPNFRTSEVRLVVDKQAGKVVDFGLRTSADPQLADFVRAFMGATRQAIPLAVRLAQGKDTKPSDIQGAMKGFFKASLDAGKGDPNRIFSDIAHSLPPIVGDSSIPGSKEFADAYNAMIGIAQKIIPKNPTKPPKPLIIG